LQQELPVSSSDFDPEILQDFLTESGELLDSFEGDLVTLEQTPDDPELLNQVFRALHTIKGSASFLGMANLVEIAHAAESALNAARNGTVIVDRQVMDLLLEAVDVLKVQFDEVRDGRELTKAEPKLVESLKEIGEGRQPGSSDATPTADAAEAQPAGTTTEEPGETDDGQVGGCESRPLNLPENKADLIEFLVADLEETLTGIGAQISALGDAESRDEAIAQLTEQAEALAKSVEFFECPEMLDLARVLERATDHVADLGEQDMAQLLPRLSAVHAVLTKQAGGLSEQRLIIVPTETLIARITALLDGGDLPEEAELAADVTTDRVLEIDGVLGASATATSAPDTSNEQPLDLPESKQTLVEFLVTDLEESLTNLDELAGKLRDSSTREQAAGELTELGEALVNSAGFFEFEPMVQMAGALEYLGEHVGGASDELMGQLLPRIGAVRTLMGEQAEAINRGFVVLQDVDQLVERLRELADGHMPESDWMLPEGADAEAALMMDGARTASAMTTEAEPAQSEQAETAQVEKTPVVASGDPAPKSPPKQAAASGGGGGAKKAAPPAVEQTIRVEVGRLETLMNLVGELVLQKNRTAALSRQVASLENAGQELVESLDLTVGTLERVTGDIQVAVMRTRMQPLDKLFGRYPRLIRDIAGKTGKKIGLVIEGGDTEVDKSVIDELGDPMVHLLRNSADHGIETPEERIAVGKDEQGTIRLVASHEGSHVQILVIDDGHGLSRERIAAKAVEKGLTTEAEISGMSDRDVFRFILAPGFSTAAQVSDLSGRGVGMDVVKSNLEKLKGTIDITSETGVGTTIGIKIPLTVAIMPAMMVGVGGEIYAIPLTNILEIVRPEADQIYTVQTHPVMRLRDSVLPLLEASDLFDVPKGQRGESPFAVVVSLNEKRVGLLVNKLIGQQEIVVKALDEMLDHSGTISGATVRDDGGVSLIVDVAQMIEIGESRRVATAAA
jgi:two-component system chemotaxis sensor kinase CheA